MDLAKIRAIAMDVAQQAGELAVEGKARGFRVQQKEGFELVTDCDRECEQLIVKELAARLPDHAIIGEEGAGETEDVDPETPTWYVDPIDGTANFAHGLPWYAVSLGLEVRGQGQVGVVHLPEPGWTFSAHRGGGSCFNGRRMRVAKTKHLRQALVATGFSYNQEDNVARVAWLRAVMGRCKDIRRVGVASLDCAMVACGWIAAYWEKGIKPWDVSAGALLVEEAGGRITTLTGDPFQSTSGEIIASNGPVHEELMSALGLA